MMKKFIQSLLLVLGLVGFSAMATLNVYDFEDSNKEQRFKVLIDELRCPKCQNNNLADSNAPLATDIKNYVYKSVNKGDSDEQITEFLISRYGQFVTYRPRNPWVWILPTAIGGFALLIAVWVIRRKRRESPQTDNESIPDMQTIIQQYQEEKQS